MTIRATKVNNPSIYGVYQVPNYVLGIGNPNKQHDVIVMSIDRKNNIANVKTITSLEYKKRNKWYFKNKKLEDCFLGNILPIPKNDLRSKVYSGIHHNSINVPIDEIYFKNDDDNTRFPFRYRKLVHNKKRSS